MDESTRLGGVKERQSAIIPVPKEIAECFVNGTWLDNAPVIHEGDKSKIMRVFEHEAIIPGFDHAELRIDVRNWHQPDESLHRNQIRFEYTVPDLVEDGPDRLVAEMHFSEIDEDSFWLQHRYVQPVYRGRKGIGSALLAQAEDWLRQVAEARHHDVTIGLTAG